MAPVFAAVATAWAHACSPASRRPPPATPNGNATKQAWEVFKRWDNPFLTLFSNCDPVTRGGHRIWQERVPGARGQPHAVIRGGGHFLQQDKGAKGAQALAAFIAATPLSHRSPNQWRLSPRFRDWQALVVATGLAEVHPPSTRCPQPGFAVQVPTSVSGCMATKSNRAPEVRAVHCSVAEDRFAAFTSGS